MLAHKRKIITKQNIKKKKKTKTKGKKKRKEKKKKEKRIKTNMVQLHKALSKVM